MKVESQSWSVNKITYDDGTVKYACKGCGKEFDKSRSAGTHTGQCKLWLDSPITYQDEYVSDNDKVESYSDKINKVIRDDIIKYACKGCNKIFTTFTAANAHAATCKQLRGKDKYLEWKDNLTKNYDYEITHSYKEVVKEDGSIKYACIGCNKEFDSKIDCRRHVGGCKGYLGEEAYNEKRDKLRETHLSEYTQNKKKETFIQNYGVDHPWKNQEVLNKRKQTNVEKYGVDNPMRDPNIVERMMNSAIKTCMEKYGVPYNCLTDNCINAGGHYISGPNKYVAELFQNEGCTTEFEYRISKYSYDIIVDNQVLVEVDPTYTHNSTVGPRFSGNQRPPMNPEYHLMKSKLANDHGFHCIHIFDWDNDILISKLLSHNKTKVYARDCEYRVIDDYLVVNEFLNKNHLQGSLRYNKSMISVGLYYNEELVSIMVFGDPRYNKNYQYELLRLCNNYDYIVIGGSQRLLSHFKKDYNPKSIISYCDKAKFDGKVYDKLGFRLINETAPTCHWYNYKNHYTDNLLRMLGADKLIGTNYGKGTSNEEIMINEGYVQIYDCGQKVYEWKMN